MEFTAGAGAIVYCAPEMFPHDDFNLALLLIRLLGGCLQLWCPSLGGDPKEMPTTDTRYSMLQQAEKEWEKMYDLIVLCTKRLPADRPTIVLNELIHNNY